MGLDMLLYARNKQNPEQERTICYWGKRWPIFAWFEKHLGEKIENGKEYIVSKEMFEEFRHDIASVIFAATNYCFSREVTKYTFQKVAEQYFPVDAEDLCNQYDTYYVNNLIDTGNKIKINGNIDFDSEEIIFIADW